ncbi:hypothetical protein Nepgr_004080 [Nepenthes gracilis]|uniref:Uncharacterized protein n=1 Tax=Nepenthes gracilis TaxID=150966 RepID=A0AAD3S104_NEPGR|nr:hypothetical protein Nepgr_004080 [Nepenthes gracilis]
MENIVKNQDTDEISYMVRSLSSATPVASLDTTSQSPPFSRVNSLSASQKPSKMAIDCASQMVLQLKLQFWILLLGLLAGKPKNILTSFQASATIVQKMDSRSRKKLVPDLDGEQGADDIEGQLFSTLKIFPLQGGSAVQFATSNTSLLSTLEVPSSQDKPLKSILKKPVGPKRKASPSIHPHD